MARPRKNPVDTDTSTALAGLSEDTPSTPKGAKTGALGAARAILSKAFKESESPEVKLDLDALTKSRPHIPSGSIVVDYLIGGRHNKNGVAPSPGWPRGTINQLWGHESAGKTTLALHACAEVHRRGGTVAFIDFENALDLAYAEGLGVLVKDKNLFSLYQPSTLEDGLKILYVLSKTGVDLIIIDSIGAGVPKRVFEQSVDEQGGFGRVGELAQLWGSFLPKLAAICRQTGTTVIGLSQLRNKISTGPMAALGDGKQPQGGEAWKFYSSVRMKLQKVFSEKNKIFDALTNGSVEQVTATKIRAKIEKSKVSASQQHEADFWVRFGTGVDDFRSVLDICSAHGTVKKGGAGWYTWVTPDGEIIKAQGMDNLRKEVEKAGAAEMMRQFARSTLNSGSVASSDLASPEVDVDIDLDELMSGGLEDLADLPVNPAFAAESEE